MTCCVMLPTDKQNNRFTQRTYYLAHRGNYVSHVTQTLTGTGNAEQQPFYQQSGGGWWKEVRPWADITTSVSDVVRSLCESLTLFSWGKRFILCLHTRSVGLWKPGPAYLKGSHVKQVKEDNWGSLAGSGSHGLIELWFYIPTRHKTGHFGDVPQTKLLAWYGKTKPNTTKAHIHQSKEMYYNTK